MNHQTKTTLLERAREHLVYVRDKVEKAVEKMKKLIATPMSAAKVEDRWTNDQVRGINRETLRRLIEIDASPYFSKCEVTYDDTKEKKTLYFGKFSFSEEQIYSWIAPAGSIRFDSPGKISYTLPNGKLRTGIMHSKDQYMITDGKLVFYSTEAIDVPRELIYQEHFSYHKSGFVLPEIVSQMEKAQDTVIRAHYKGPFVISGPAGSGKTTLALHRIAYLMQSPSTTELFPDHSILILVQDEGAKAYFSTLLPSLGINSVGITTFTEWAAKIIGVEGYTYHSQFAENDLYEFKKVKALRESVLPKFSKNSFLFLQKVYEKYFDEEDKKIFEKQKVHKTLDRIDLTVLLSAFLSTHKKLSTTRKYTRVDSGGTSKTGSTILRLEYSLIAIDEFQNYLPEQIKLFKNCLNEKTNSLMYIGDMKQQVRVGTIKDWKDITEYVDNKRQVKLEKVYRNTKEIVEYIKQQGFPIEVPVGIKSGSPVKEITETTEGACVYVKNLLSQLAPQETLGVIVSSEIESVVWKEKLGTHSQLHILTARQSQGLEFDKVCIIRSKETKVIENIDVDGYQEFKEELEKITKDLLYVSLTRAIVELHVIRVVN